MAGRPVSPFTGASNLTGRSECVNQEASKFRAAEEADELSPSHLPPQYSMATTQSPESAPPMPTRSTDSRSAGNNCRPRARSSRVSVHCGRAGVTIRSGTSLISAVQGTASQRIYSITPSARASTAGGKVILIAFAVLRLSVLQRDTEGKRRTTT